MSPAVTADILGEVARRTAATAVREAGITHPGDIAYRVERALDGAVLTLEVLAEERK